MGAVVTAALTTVAPRLRKLVLMLSSDHDGEVIGAARAIGRALKDAGADWHDLVKALTAPTVTEYTPPPPPYDFEDWRDLRAFCMAHAYLLLPRERAFVVDLGLWQRDLTPKQHNWLAAIYERLRESA